MKTYINKRLLTTASATLLCFSLWAQSTVRGRVVDPQGKPLAGAVVVVEGTSTGTMTDADGNYQLAVPEGAKINYSYGSFAPETLSVGSADTYNVTLGLAKTAEAAPAEATSQSASDKNINLTGRVTDKDGNPIAGASIVVVGTTIGTISDPDGNYSMTVPANAKIATSFVGYNTSNDKVEGRSTVNIVLLSDDDNAQYDFVNQKISVGANRTFSRTESAAAVSVIGQNGDHRSAKNIAWSTIGEGHGLISLDNVGTYYGAEPTWYVRGLQSLNGSSPLVLVDGIERDITTLSPFEVEEVQILKDAAAVALYGYKGVNNAVLIKTKRGLPEQNTVSVTYDHAIKRYVDKPEFIDATTFARARNEALANEGSAAQYSDRQIKAFEDGDMPYYYPNVDWVGEVFRQNSYTNRYAVDFRGGGKKFRYFTALNLTSDKGFIANHDINSGYDTQDMYSRGNLRSNLDIDMTDYTKLQINVGGVLSEMSCPGSQFNLWSTVYAVPAAAYPVKNERDVWGGNATWDGVSNPVANAVGAGYYKIHERALFADIDLKQSLGMFVDGLGMFGRLAFDNYSTLYEDHSKTFSYGQTATSFDESGNLVLGDYYTSGSDGVLGSGAATSSWRRRGTINAGFDYDHQFNDDNSLFAQIKWDYEFEDATSTNTTIYRQNFSWYSHYGLMNKYFVDLALVGSESSKLVDGTKWAFAPTVAVAWAINKEDFMSGLDWVNFMKLRASFGKINSDYTPSWTYDTQLYDGTASQYFWDSKNNSTTNAAVRSLGQMATTDPTNEKAYKLNVGLDARLFGGLDVEFDYFHQKNKDAFISGAGAYSSVIGFTAPYVNQGETTSSGVELALDYNHMFGDVCLNVGGNILYSHSKIDEQKEEPRLYPNLVTTGNPLSSTYGLIAEGLFKDQADVDNSPKQSFTTTRPGDIKYTDVNGDGVVDANDVCRIGYSTAIPEVYYSFHVGAGWKGLSFSAMFQGVGRYTAILNTPGYYWGLIGNTNLSQEVYDNRWTADNTSAKYPRLSSASNANNYTTSTFWMEDRSFLKLRNVELSYDFAKSILDNTFVTKAQLYVRGVDLFTWDKIDDRDAATLGYTPTTRSLIVGLSLGF
mgnify:CR=1 FL=1